METKRWKLSSVRALLRLCLIVGTTFISIRQAHLLTKFQESLFGMEEPRGLGPNTNLRHHSSTPPKLEDASSNEYILWSKDETYFEECRTHFIGNKTWGKERSMLVDKIEAKKIVEGLNVSGLLVPPTLAVLGGASAVRSFTADDMMALPQPYIVKASHTSGGVARVKDGIYDCFKRCERRTSNRFAHRFRIKDKGGRGLDYFQGQSMADLRRDFSKKHNESQYKGLQPRILIEPDILLDQHDPDVTFWYVANGKPLFVSLQCDAAKDGLPGTTADRVFVSTRYERLDMSLARGACAEMPAKPDNWDQQVEIATHVASVAPGVVRLDLYTGGGKVFFSEFTFTTNYCARGIGFHPRVADGLLYAVAHNEIDPAVVTADYVEQIISRKSWTLVSLQNDVHLVREQSRGFPSPVDLCESVHSNQKLYKSKSFQNNGYIKSCLGALKEASSEPLRCVISSTSGDHNNNHPLRAIGVQKHPTFASVMARVDWGRAILLLVVVGVLTYTGTCTNHERNQFLKNILYLILMAGVICVTTNVEGLYSGNSISTLVTESYRAFVYVHPMESPLIAISHFCTYWFYIASWNSKSLRNMLFWQFCIEAITASVNEYTHHTEEQNDVRCMRIAFIGAFKNYAVDNIIRVYILPPFFVFGYMLPKFLHHWLLVGLTFLFP